MKQLKGVFLITSVLFFLSAISPVFILFAVGDNGKMNALGTVAGGMFWGGLILGVGSYIVMNRLWKEKCKKAKKEGEKKLITAFRFFRNPLAVIIDIAMILGIAGVIYSIVDITANNIIVVISMVMMLAGVYGHFLVNGDIYQYIWSRKKC